jgi:hypothetical protein
MAAEAVGVADAAAEVGKLAVTVAVDDDDVDDDDVATVGVVVVVVVVVVVGAAAVITSLLNANTMQPASFSFVSISFTDTSLLDDDPAISVLTSIDPSPINTLAPLRSSSYAAIFSCHTDDADAASFTNSRRIVLPMSAVHVGFTPPFQAVPHRLVLTTWPSLSSWA